MPNSKVSESNVPENNSAESNKSQPASSAELIARTELLDMVPYQSARRLFSSKSNTGASSKIWLNANESSGPGLYQLSGKCINRYPDFQPDDLIQGYADYANLGTDQVLCTRGADEGIELVIRTFCQAYQDSILICPPTYGMYAISAENHGADVIKVPLINSDQGEMQLDVDAICQQVGKVKVVFLCSPGNPTGNLLSASDIETVITAFKGSAIVVVDEAYIEFAPEHSFADKIDQYDNLVVLRTLSKAFALAGLRCGFTLANSNIIELLSKVIAPYPVPAPVAEIAINALAPEQLLQTQIRAQESNQLKASLSTWLESQTWCQKVYPSDANFVLFRTDYKDDIFKLLLSQGILIRDQSKQLQLDNCLRISIGSERELNLVKQIISQQLVA